ncbi:MAG: tetratricopeptide repeat protein [Acetobacter sp.]|nr:tetratricopeptide repeat protein [Acetobacter sp.]
MKGSRDMAKDIKRRNEENKENGGKQYFNLDAEKAFFEEVDEEVRNERFKELVNKYGGYILAVLVVALSFAVGYERIAQWRISKAEQKNVQYVQALAPTPDYENNIVALENIVATEKGLYRDMAYLQIASLLLENNQTDKGLEVLGNIYQDETVTDKVREIAAVKLATYKVDTSNYQEIETLLMPIIQKNGAWAVMAKELLAMSAIQNKDMNKAKDIYQELLANTNISEEFKARINDMLASINEAQ